MASRRKGGRPSKVEGYRALVTGELRARPNSQTIALLDLAKRHGYAGGASAFYEMVGNLRGKLGVPAPQKPTRPGVRRVRAQRRLAIEVLSNTIQRLTAELAASRAQIARLTELIAQQAQTMNQMLAGRRRAAFGAAHGDVVATEGTT